MKKTFKFYVFFLLTTLITMISCTKNEMVEEREFIEVGLNIKTDRLPLASETPLTKAGDSKDIYGFNIYEYTDVYEENPYCYGLFTSLDKLVVKFRKGYKYCIFIDYIPNGQNIIGFNSKEWGSPYHRALHIEEKSKITFNKLVYDSENWLMALGNPIMHIAPNKLFGPQSRGNFERYLYQIWDFTPPANGEEVDIKLLRANAGVTFIFEKVEGYSYSKVDVKIDCFENTVDLTETNTLQIPQITMGRSYNLDSVSNDAEVLKVVIGTPKNDSEIFNGEIEIKRNTMRTYTVKLKPQSTTENPFDVTMENGDMATENNGNLN